MPILVVDDDHVFRSSINTILRRAGFRTFEARDGLEAYEIVRTIGASIELLLTDLQMPRMDGLSLIESVRELHPKMPVLLITGLRPENQSRNYAVLTKPIGSEALLEAVRRAIEAAGTKKPARKIEVFISVNCPSEKLLMLIEAAACPSCEFKALNVADAEVAERANRLGVHSVPAVAINDELVCCPCECGPDLAKLRAAGLGAPLP
jgi:DNA-binding NtrC family response regulator